MSQLFANAVSHCCCSGDDTIDQKGGTEYLSDLDFFTDQLQGPEPVVAPPLETPSTVEARSPAPPSTQAPTQTRPQPDTGPRPSLPTEAGSKKQLTVGSDADFQTINEALKQAKSGDTILVKAGEYKEKINLTQQHQGVTLLAEKTGAAKIFGDIQVYKTSDIKVSGFDVSNADDPKTNPAIHVINSHHVEISDNIAHDSGGSGISAVFSDWLKLENNTAFGNAKKNPNQGSGISIFQPRDLADQGSSSETAAIVVRGNRSFENENITPNKEGKLTDGNGIILDDFDNSQGVIGGDENNQGEKKPYLKEALIEKNETSGNAGAGIRIFKSNNQIQIANNQSGQNNQRGDSNKEINITKANNVSVQ